MFGFGLLWRGPLEGGGSPGRGLDGDKVELSWPGGLFLGFNEAASNHLGLDRGGEGMANDVRHHHLAFTEKIPRS